MSDLGGRAGGVDVQTHGLSKRFTRGAAPIVVLEDVDVRIDAGESVAVVGPSGAGKSTLLHILGTLERPTEGAVFFDGRDVFSRGKREIDALRNREIGLVFQFHHLLPDQSAVDNVAMPLIIRGARLPDARTQAEDILTRVGMGHRLTHRPGELSGGEQQRVAISRALVTRPRLLLADEPTGNLDPRTAGGVFDLLLELNREAGCTLVMVTHSRELAQRFPRRLEMVDAKLLEA